LQYSIKAYIRLLMKSLKLTYHISRKISIDSTQIKALIVMGLKDKKYKIESAKNNEIIFDGQPGRSFNRLSIGKIEIEKSGNESIVELEYYANLLVPLIFFIITLIIGVGLGMYSFPIVAAILLTIQELIRKIVWADMAEHLLKDLFK